MYGNLELGLRNKNITVKTVAGLLDCSEKTVRNKIDGLTDFTICEAFSIHRNLLPEYAMDFLFAQTDRTA